MKQHTPAPWIIDGRVIRTEFGGQVCMFSNLGSANKQDWNANAILIAAAPELLEALVAIKNQPNARYEVEANVGGWVWDAIAKATGA